MPEKLTIKLAAALLGSAAMLVPVAASSQEPKLPPSLTFTAYDTGTSGFNITVAVGKGLQDKFKTELRVLPAGNDVARLGPVKAGRAQVSAMGVGIYYAQEGVFEFSAKDWGPQPLMLLLSSVDCNGANLGIAKDTGAKDLKDLKGKRIGFVVGSPALNQNALAMLAFAGLKKEDVRIVEFGGFGAMWKGMINNEIDAAYASTITGNTKEVETSPRGLVWPPLPPGDKEGWARVNKIAPYIKPHKATCGSGGISAQNPIEMGGFPYPLYTVYGGLEDELAYSITKAMILSYDVYKDGAPGASGLGIERQTTQWVLPFHAGAVKAFKESGIWKPADEEHNQHLLKRQKVLGEAWAAFLKTNPPDDKAAFQKAWMAARNEALLKAKMDPVFEGA
jgi:TRAP transporter TAXI family solute receptor